MIRNYEARGSLWIKQLRKGLWKGEIEGQSYAGSSSQLCRRKRALVKASMNRKGCEMEINMVCSGKCQKLVWLKTYQPKTEKVTEGSSSQMTVIQSQNLRLL